MKLIVGLGNPGKEYKNTHHNIGFIVVDNYLGKVNWKTKMEAHIFVKEMNNEQVIFIKPLTYMNLSGLAVRKIVDYYKIKYQDILVIQDDLDLEFGNYKIKRNSSSGGHNGIKSIIKELETEAFARLKIGIGKNSLIPTDKYVLSKFTKNEQQILDEKMPIFTRIIDDFITKDLETVMGTFNKN